MQPIHLEPLGSVNFSKFKTDTLLRNTTQIVFSSSSATVCLYDLHKLECFRDSPNWSHQFTWIPIIDIKHLLDNTTDSPDDVYNWYIKKVMFLNTSTTVRQSLAVVLVNINQNRSLVCFFRSLSTAKCNIAILIHGVLTSLEWLPLIDIGCKPSESHSMESNTMDMLDEDTAKITSKTLSCVLSIFDGCFALGFQQGLVGLLDMCLTQTRDDLVNDKPETSIAVERSHCLNCFSCKQPMSQLSNGNTIEHSLVYLDASVLRWNDFTYKSVSGKTLSSIPSAGVYVSALSYIPQLQGLAVGFSFGGWQLWSLDRLNMEFCLRQATPTTPVVSFNFLEPSDDPRFCCFLWVGWQSKQHEVDGGVFKFTGKQSSTGNFQSPTVKLFQLSYRRRYELFSNKHKEFNFYYQDLVGIAERLSTTLSGDKIDDIKPPYTSKLLSVQSLHAPYDFIMDQNNHHSNNHTVTSHSIGMIRLIAFIWKFSECVIRIGLFDLDRWYHAQMPTYIRSDDTFVAIFDALIPSQKVQLLDTYLIESSLISFCLSRIVFVSRQEECIMELNTYTKRSLSSSSTFIVNKHFNIIQWLSNSWKSGLLESPGLDPFDEDELINLLSFAQNTTPNNKHHTLWQNSNEYSFTLAYGEYCDKSIKDSLDKLLRNLLTTVQLDSGNPLNNVDNSAADNDVGNDELILSKRSSKYRRLDQTINSHSTTIKPMKSKCQYSLNPCWVLLANCLLEHGCINVLKNLDKLSPPGEESPVNINFKYSWIWLRFCRLKGRFDKLTSVLFTSNSLLSEGQEHESILPNQTDHCSRVPDLLELGCTFNQIQLLATLAKYWFTTKNHNFNDNSNIGLQCLSTKLSLSSEHPIQLSIQTYFSYAKLVIFLLRLGLLPQSDEKLCDSKYLAEISPRMNNTVLLPYKSSILADTITELRCTHLISNNPVNVDMNSDGGNTNRLRTISEHILYSALQTPSKHSNNDANDSSFSNDEVYDLWKEHEQLTKSEMKSFNSTHPKRIESSLYNDLPVWLNYPPKHLQSLCSLWQLPQDQRIKKSRLIILGFVLCDAAAGTFLINSNYYDHFDDHMKEADVDVKNTTIDNNTSSTDIKSTNSGSLRALQLCRYIMSLFIKEFPSAYPLVPTIISLWLMDRGYFQESISPQIISFIMNTPESQSLSSYHQVFSDIFPNQINLMINLFSHYGHEDLIHELLKYLTINSSSSSSLKQNPNSYKVQMSFRQLFNKVPLTPTTTTVMNTSSINKLNMKPIGAPYLALIKLRNLIHKMNQLHNHTPLTMDMLNSVDKLARDSLIQLAEICRQAGRLGDLISLGLNNWEAKVLFEYYQKTGQHNLLFHCLIARSQYQTAMAIINNYRRVTPSFHKPEQLYKYDDISEHRLQLELMTQLLTSCLPLLNATNECNKTSSHSDNLKLDHFKALANEYVSIDDFQTNSESSSLIHDDNVGEMFESVHLNQPSSLSQSSSSIQLDDGKNFIAYKQTTPLVYPLTNVKKHIQHKLTSSTKHPFNYLTDDQYLNSVDNIGDNDITDDEIIRNNRINNSNSWLLATNKKHRQEFWSTFKECIYTPPSCGRKEVYLNATNRLITPSTMSLFNNSISSPSNQKPVSILKTRSCSSDKGACVSTVDPSSTTVTTATTISSSTRSCSSLNSVISPSTSLSCSIIKSTLTNQVEKPIQLTSETYSTIRKSDYIRNNNNNEIHVNDDDDDCDVTLNLSTVRPSVVNIEKSEHITTADNVVMKCNEFIFSAPRRISLTQNTPTSNKSQQKKEFLFSAPLVNMTVKRMESVDNVTVSPTSVDELNMHPSYSKSTSSDTDVHDDPLNSDHVETSKTFLVGCNDTISLTNAPIFTPPKLQNSCSSSDYIHTKETIHDVDATPKVASNSRKSRGYHPKTSTQPSQLTTEAILDHLDRLHEERHHYHYNQPTDMDDFDDTSSITSSVTDSSETLRRSTRRVRPPKRYDSSAV
ncbi:Protein ELYS [Schistosoma japonicum]|uniref:Protein ELYS n=1 Tax=Schistosoma japonicum TaxID=6182 RepID=A0A4Z2CTM7_SCHJA|nr:Protein ELYS [Schistosoma japonicum]